MDVTYQISQEARDVMINNVYSGLGGVDVYLIHKEHVKMHVPILSIVQMKRLTT